MTTRELFLHVVKSEQPIFERVLKAVNQEKWDYRPDPVTKSGKEIANLIATEPAFLANLIKTQTFGWSEPAEPKSVQELVDKLNKGFEDVKKAAEETNDQTWDTEVVMKMTEGEWKDKLGIMAFGFLFDMIHHRGQISTYLRSMGGKVPSIYGPSGDSNK
ncbi:DinB family protein [Candidatus Parcubacteria bacterium]|nr:DinB family protein [Candidatus Parcubacteria bacterium]